MTVEEEGKAFLIVTLIVLLFFVGIALVMTIMMGISHEVERADIPAKTIYPEDTSQLKKISSVRLREGDAIEVKLRCSGCSIGTLQYRTRPSEWR